MRVSSEVLRMISRGAVACAVLRWGCVFSNGTLWGVLITNIKTLLPQYFVGKMVLRISWKLLASSSDLLLAGRDTNW